MPITEAVCAADDSDLIRLFESRDEQAIAETQARYGSLCSRLVNRILNSSEDTEECISDAMLQIWNAIPPAKPKSFRAFLITITKRIAMNRQEQKQAAKRGGKDTDISLEALPDAFASPDDTALAAEQRIMKAALQRFLISLPKQSRLILIDHYWLMCSVGEIAEEHGISRSAVKMSLLRSRKKLEEFLRKEGLL
jgi:RNA polymerase sigma-70 factor (ECF subfamily)